MTRVSTIVVGGVKELEGLVKIHAGSGNLSTVKYLLRHLHSCLLHWKQRYSKIPIKFGHQGISSDETNVNLICLLLFSLP